MIQLGQSQLLPWAVLFPVLSGTCRSGRCLVVGCPQQDRHGDTRGNPEETIDSIKDWSRSTQCVKGGC